MKKRIKISLMLIIVLSSASPHLWARQADAGDGARPNIILILADDLGYNEVGVYGQKTIKTPSLDRMAREGMRFTCHYAGGPVCGPSRATLMTGQSQAIGYIKGNPGGNPQRENLRAQDVTVAELLKSAGYTTACIGKWGLGPQGLSGYPLKQGFDYFVGYDTHVAAHDYYPAALCKNDGKLKLTKGTYSHDVFTEEALAFLKRKKDAPYFLYLAYTIPHDPYNPPDLGPYVDKKWPTLNKKYASMIHRLDRDVGRVLDAVAASKEDTLVIFTSDNGPQSSGSQENALTKFFDSNGDLRGIKRDVYNGGVQVPFIAWWPGKIEAGTKSDHISSFQDFVPSMCELTGAKPTSPTDGISFVPTLLGQNERQKQHEWLYWEYINMSNDPSGRQGVMNPKLGFKAVRFGRKGPVELYHLYKDVGETRNVAKEYPEIAKSMGHYMDTCRNESELWPITFHDRGDVSTFSPEAQKN